MRNVLWDKCFEREFEKKNIYNEKGGTVKKVKLVTKI